MSLPKVCDWIYGLPYEDEHFLQYAREHGCVDRDENEDNTYVNALFHLRRKTCCFFITPCWAIDLKDGSKTRVIALKVDYPTNGRYTKKDEQWIAELLGIKEEWKWYKPGWENLYNHNLLEAYRSMVPGPIPEGTLNMKERLELRKKHEKDKETAAKSKAKAASTRKGRKMPVKPTTVDVKDSTSQPASAPSV